MRPHVPGRVLVASIIAGYHRVFLHALSETRGFAPRGPVEELIDQDVFETERGFARGFEDGPGFERPFAEAQEGAEEAPGMEGATEPDVNMVPYVVELVTAYIEGNTVAAAEYPRFIKSVYEALLNLDGISGEVEFEEQQPEGQQPEGKQPEGQQPEGQQPRPRGRNR